ncbi:hypothetical protein L9F63_015897, partial [Diploptera punctata]
MTIHGNGHAFMQANNEVRYFVDGIGVSSVHEELTSSAGVRMPTLDENSMYNNKLHLKFEPPVLDFKQRHLGIPHHEKVTLFNVNNNKTIHMSSISGSTVHFHSSFFQDKVIPPLGNTSFNVVFLGREEGEIESSLFIHTSEGSIKYQVKGASVSSPYRLRPLVGVRVPLNSTYSPLIYMHNPHSTPMQIVEVYSSGGEFHLELPSGELEGPKHLWEIPPFRTKPVIRIRFVAKAEKNHTAYVRIKVNKSEEVLVVPIEVEVASHAGLYSPDDVLDFGIGGSRDKPKQVSLLLFNSWKKMIRIQNVIATPVSKALKIDFQPVKVPPDSKTPTQVAIITFDWKTAFERKQFSGKLVIKSKQNQHKLVIPYVAHVLEGGLEFNASVTQYCSDLGHNLGVRNFTVTNAFKTTVALVNVSLPKEAQAHFMIQKFSPTVLEPGEKVVLFQLAIKKETIESELKLESHLLLHTNISTVSISLFCYNGRLMRVMLAGLNETELNFGTVGSNSQKEAYFALVNNNPVAVLLKSWGTNMTGALVELVGVEEGNQSSVLQRHSFTNMSTTLVLMPGHYAVFKVFLQVANTEGTLNAEVFVKTQFERVVIGTSVTVAHGRLETIPQSLILQDCFPGKLCVQELHVRSTFTQEMTVTSVTSVPPDIRVSYSAANTRIVPLNTSTIGELSYNPAIACRTQCYLGISANSTTGDQWLYTLSLPIHAQDTDLTLLNTRHNRYMALTDGGTVAWHNMSVRLDTTHVRNHLLQVKMRLTWPRLQRTNTSVITFPLTQIGNTTHRDVLLHNPSSQVVVVQLALESVYMPGRHLMENLPRSFQPDCKDCLTAMAGEFSWADGGEASLALQNELGVPVHKNTYATLLQPGATVAARLSFKPMRPGPVSALIYMRNNLTILERIRVEGHAAHAQFKFGNRKPGSGTPLLFELAEKHLKDCEREKHRKYPVPNLTVKRSFTARNTGELPIHITAFNINGLPCEGYGFRILNCAPFHLLPNGTRKIDIAFTPDFTLARIQRTLVIETSLGIPVNYTLITTLPPYFLQTCSSVLGRPSWEPLLYYSAISFMAFLLFCVLAAAFLESDRILKCALMAMARDRAARASVQPSKPDPDWHLNVIKNTAQPPGPGNKNSSWNAAEESKEGDPMLTIKNKKKVGKRGSGNSEKTSTDTGKVKNKDSKRLTRSLKKNKTEPEPEEDTSSTTTESSNNEEIEKANGNVREGDSNEYPEREMERIKKDKDSTNLYYKDNYEGDYDDDDYERDAHKKKESSGHWKSPHKTPTVVKPDESAASRVPHPPSLELPYKLKSSKNTSRDRKDRNVLKRRTTDKLASTKGPLTALESSNTVGSSVRVSPSLRTSSCWGEQRATFSDVVARSDSALYSSIVAPRKRTQLQQQAVQNKVTAFPDNCAACNSSSSSSSSTSSCSGAAKKLTETTSALGPIGSRKTSSTPGYTDSQLQPDTDSTSLFTTSFSSSAQPLQLIEQLWTHSLWDPLVSQPPVSVWGSFVNSVWSSSPWTTGSVTSPGPIVPPAPRQADLEDEDIDEISLNIE